MDKFAVDLDKILDDLESCDGTVVYPKQDVQGSSKTTVDVPSPWEVGKFKERPSLLDRSPELIDLSDADFGPSPVPKHVATNSLLMANYKPSQVALPFSSCDNDLPYAPVVLKAAPSGPGGTPGGMGRPLVNILDMGPTAADKLPLQLSSDMGGSMDLSSSVAVLARQSSESSEDSVQDLGSRLLTADFNPLDSEPYFTSAAGYPDSTAAAVVLVTQEAPAAASITKQMTNGFGAKHHWSDSGPSAVNRPSSALNIWEDDPNTETGCENSQSTIEDAVMCDQVPGNSQTNSLLSANGVHATYPLVSSFSRSAPPVNYLRFADIRVDDQEDDESVDAYLADMANSQSSAPHHRNALLEANLPQSAGGMGEWTGLSTKDAVSLHSSDEDPIVPQFENALLQANLVVSSQATLDVTKNGVIEVTAHRAKLSDLGGLEGVTSNARQENLLPTRGADNARSSRPQADDAPTGEACQSVVAASCCAELAALAPPPEPAVSTSNAVSIGSDRSKTTHLAAQASAAAVLPAASSENAVASNGSGTREPRRPTSLLGLSKVALSTGFIAPPSYDSALAARRPRTDAPSAIVVDSDAASSPAGSSDSPSTVRSKDGTRVDSWHNGAEITRTVSDAHVAANQNATDPSGGQATCLSNSPLPSGGVGGFREDSSVASPLPSFPAAAHVDEPGGSSGGGALEWDYLGATKPMWIPDAEAIECMGCSCRFTFTKRRHHCRACGRVFCASCCNMKSKLLYLDFKEARVCSQCHEQLAVAELRQRELLGQPLSPSSGPDAHSGVHGSAADTAGQTPLQVADAGSAEAFAPPVAGVLRRTGSRGAGQSKMVMFSDGIRPGGDLAHLDGSVSTPATAPVVSALSASAGLATAKVKKKGNSLGDLIKPKTAFIIPKSGLPPVLFFTDSRSQEYVIDENPNSDLLLEAMRDETGVSSFAFVIHKDLYIFVKLVQLDCCAKKLCWCFSSKGLCTVGQEEVVVVLECQTDEKEVPVDMFYFYRMLYEQAFKGTAATELSFSICTRESLRKSSDGFLGSKEHGGFLYVRPSYQCLQGLSLPQPPYLFAVLLDKWELPWAKVFPLRLALRLGAEYRYYPCPLVSVRGRKSVYGEIGHTIMNLLADFRNYQYTLSRVEGVTVHLEDKVTVISLPKNKYNEIAKVLSSSNDYVLAMGANFSAEADSHLVCVQDDDGSYQTQAINIQDKPRRVTGANFVVFSGALKASGGITAKSSIVEDGLMVQILPEAMLELKTKIKNMQDHVIKCGVQQTVGSAEEAVHIKWVDEYKKYNVGVTSPIDGFPLDGVESVRIYGCAEMTGGRRSVRWTEVFFLQNEEPGNTPADPVDLSRLSETLACSCTAAMAPHLERLKDVGMVKIGLRVTLGADQVGYEIGSNGNKLPSYILNDLDNELIPVIHSTASLSPSGGLTVIELIFHILE